MLINKLELTHKVEKIIGEYGFLMKTKADLCTPLKYRGIYECIGVLSVWDDVGGIYTEVKMYRPVGGGTVYYDWQES